MTEYQDIVFNFAFLSSFISSFRFINWNLHVFYEVCRSFFQRISSIDNVTQRWFNIPKLIVFVERVWVANSCILLHKVSSYFVSKPKVANLTLLQHLKCISSKPFLSEKTLSNANMTLIEDGEVIRWDNITADILNTFSLIQCAFQKSIEVFSVQ